MSTFDLERAFGLSGLEQKRELNFPTLAEMVQFYKAHRAEANQGTLPEGDIERLQRVSDHYHKNGEVSIASMYFNNIVEVKHFLRGLDTEVLETYGLKDDDFLFTNAPTADLDFETVLNNELYDREHYQTLEMPIPSELSTSNLRDAPLKSSESYHTSTLDIEQE